MIRRSRESSRSGLCERWKEHESGRERRDIPEGGNGVRGRAARAVGRIERRAGAVARMAERRRTMAATSDLYSRELSDLTLQRTSNRKLQSHLTIFGCLQRRTRHGYSCATSRVRFLSTSAPAQAAIVLLCRSKRSTSSSSKGRRCKAQATSSAHREAAHTSGSLCSTP